MSTSSHIENWSSIERVSTEILSQICFELNGFELCCFALSSPEIYSICKSVHPEPFDLLCHEDGEELLCPRPPREARHLFCHDNCEKIMLHRQPCNKIHLADMLQDWNGFQGYGVYYFGYIKSSHAFDFNCKFMRLSVYGDSAGAVSEEKCSKIWWKYFIHLWMELLGTGLEGLLQSPCNAGDEWNYAMTPPKMRLPKKDLKDRIRLYATAIGNDVMPKQLEMIQQVMHPTRRARSGIHDFRRFLFANDFRPGNEFAVTRFDPEEEPEDIFADGRDIFGL